MIYLSLVLVGMAPLVLLGLVLWIDERKMR
jgi:hypothetical protein